MQTPGPIGPTSFSSNTPESRPGQIALCDAESVDDEDATFGRFVVIILREPRKITRLGYVELPRSRVLDGTYNSAQCCTTCHQ